MESTSDRLPPYDVEDINVDFQSVSRDFMRVLWVNNAEIVEKEWFELIDLLLKITAVPLRGTWKGLIPIFLGVYLSYCMYLVNDIRILCPSLFYLTPQSMNDPLTDMSR